MSSMETVLKISKIEGPILVLGAGGFVGSRLLEMLLAQREDVYGTYHSDLSKARNSFDRFLSHVITCDLSKHAQAVIEHVKPRTIIDLIAYGGYLGQTDVKRTYETNVLMKAELLELAALYGIKYIHAGSSSEYGNILAAPHEHTAFRPHTHYSVAKGAASGMIHYFGNHRNLDCVNLRLYAIYGPNEPVRDRLIPQLILQGLKGEYPPLVDPNITRDFIFVDDVCEALIHAGAREGHGESYNIGTGIPTSIGVMAHLCKAMLKIPKEPVFNLPARPYDIKGRWYADTNSATVDFGWSATTGLYDGLRETIRWFRDRIQD